MSITYIQTFISDDVEIGTINRSSVGSKHIIPIGSVELFMTDKALASLTTALLAYLAKERPFAQLPQSDPGDECNCNRCSKARHALSICSWRNDRTKSVTT